MKNNYRGSTRTTRLKALDTLPVLLHEADTLMALQITQQQLDGLVRDGRLENCTVIGTR